MVVALQGNPRDDSVVDHEAAALARRTGSDLVAVRVVPLDDPRVPRTLGPFSYLGPHHLPSAGDDPRLAYAIRSGREVGVDVEAELVASSDQAKAIAEAAGRHDASVVLIEAPGTGLAARLRGRRLARRVRRLAHVPVFTAGSEPAGRSL
ncbi:MAG: universal stress protein [Gaiellaceae bacterium]